MHAGLEVLLAIRDGASISADRHVDSCQECQHELREIETLIDDIRRLPDRNVAADAWRKILLRREAAANEAFKPPTVSRFDWRIAASIGVFVALALAIGIGRRDASPATGLDSLIAESQQLENRLTHQRALVAQLTPRQQFRVERLQWELVRLDSQLQLMRDDAENREHQRQLWASRVQHMTELLDAYAGENPMLRHPVEGTLL